MTMTCSIAVAAQAVTHSQDHSRLVLAALAGIATIILLIVWRKIHPFLALTLGSAVLALAAGIPLADTFTAFTAGLGSTIGGVGTLIAFGAIIGRLLIDSGGADQIVDTILDSTSGPGLPWAMALIAFVVGIPLFFEVGIVLLIPVVMIVARRARRPLVLVGIPALAGLSALYPARSRTALQEADEAANTDRDHDGKTERPQLPRQPPPPSCKRRCRRSVRIAPVAARGTAQCEDEARDAVPEDARCLPTRVSRAPGTPSSIRLPASSRPVPIACVRVRHIALPVLVLERVEWGRKVPAAVGEHGSGKPVHGHDRC